MASTPQTPSPLSRLTRFLRPGPSSPLAREHNPEKPTDEDWYIPYNGPYEQPHSMQHGGDRDSWGQLVSGWLAGDDPTATDRQGSISRNRAVSDASALTHSSGVIDPIPRSTVRNVPRTKISSIVNLAQAGGVGEVPMPSRATQVQDRTEPNRHSLASILAFGQGSRRGLVIRHSASAGQLGRDASGTAAVAVPSGGISRESAPHADAEPDAQAVHVRRHPYAFPFSVASPSPVKAAHVTVRDPPHRRSQRTATPPYLKITPAPNTRRSLKASFSTPNLRDHAAPPPPRSAPVSVPKGKQRWLSPETWCDALILPRPRFAIRVDPGGVSGRIVSPPGSPVWPPVASPFGQARPATVMGASIDQDDHNRRKGLYESRPAVASTYAAPSEPIAGPSHVARDDYHERPRDDTRGSGDVRDDDTASPTAGSSKKKAPRPKSFAWDDLALPSPVPSLAKVLEEGRQLDEQRKAWQSQATRSFQNKRARSISRTRAKSLVNSSARPRTKESGRGSAMDVIAERTMLGNQARPPTVHIRLNPSQSQAFRASEEHGTGTMTGTGAGITTFTSTGSHARTRSHTHSNSIGTNASSRNQTDESFMWGGAGSGTHTRAHSLGKSALRIVRTTASSAANFCGFASAERVVDQDRDQGATSPTTERSGADMLETALRRDDTRVIRLRDQTQSRGRRGGGEEGVVHITPASPRETRDARVVPQYGGLGVDVGPSGAIGVSPVPSAGSNSGEGVGIAITTATPTDERHQFIGREPLRLPAHPYAQGGFYAHRQLSMDQDYGPTSSNPPRSQSTAIVNDLHRQPVSVHPYSPYAQGGHPYASPMRARTSPETNGGHEGHEYQEIELRADASMFAELTPGYIREFQPDELTHSPSIVVQPIEPKETEVETNTTTSPRSHPYASQPKRMSEWGFADALTHTLRDRVSHDSGLGTSENHAVPDFDETAPQTVPDSAIHIPVLQEDFLSTERSTVPETPRGPRGRPNVGREATHSSSNHTLASSPMENVNPPTFRRKKSSGFLAGNSSGSSPGLVSHESSPPLSPRPLNATDDLDRFRNLFYQPPQERSRTPSETLSRPAPSRQLSGSIPLDISSESTRSVSGLTTLARQLAEDLEELREIRESEDMDGAASPMWGRRLGGLRGRRPDDATPDPNLVLSQTSSGTSSPPEATSPLRFPLDPHTSLAPPIINVPEDVESSSRASSELEAPLFDESHEHLRLGTVEALATPPPLASPNRASTRLSLIHFAHGESDVRHSGSHYRDRISSQYSSLGAPISDAARSSYMTNTSRMSGLSDFPAPPTETPEHMSVLNSYFDDSPLSQPEGSFPFASRPTRTLVREPSRGTFGRQSDVGQAL